MNVISQFIFILFFGFLRGVSTAFQTGNKLQGKRRKKNTERSHAIWPAPPWHPRCPKRPPKRATQRASDALPKAFPPTSSPPTTAISAPRVAPRALFPAGPKRASGAFPIPWRVRGRHDPGPGGGRYGQGRGVAAAQPPPQGAPSWRDDEGNRNAGKRRAKKPTPDHTRLATHPR
jgi:hypothetical protein